MKSPALSAFDLDKENPKTLERYGLTEFGRGALLALAFSIFLIIIYIALRFDWKFAVPMIVALPANEEDVAAVLRICHELRVPVVARGAGTGLSGGAMPHADGVTLSMAKFNRIISVDAHSRTAVVQCGVRNLAISEAAAPLGLYYAPDPSSQIACTIGGNVAENSGGVHCLKYGLTVHNVMKVKGYTIEGEPIELGSDALDTPGYDLLAVVVGSEGMLAVTTEVTVRLVPKPQLARCIMASFDDVRRAGEAVAAVIAASTSPPSRICRVRLA